MSIHKHTNTKNRLLKAMTLSLSLFVCICDHEPVCVSFQSVHASVPLIILIWLGLLLACLVGDKAEGLFLAHT